MSRVFGWRNVLEIRPGAGGAPNRVSLGVSVGLSAGAVVVLMGLSLGDLGSQALPPASVEGRAAGCSQLPGH